MNIQTLYLSNDSKDYVTLTCDHNYYVSNVPDKIPGIYKTIFSTTVCPRCSARMTFVQPKYKCQCHNCNLWMTNLKMERRLFVDRIDSTLLIWDESVLKI